MPRSLVYRNELRRQAERRTGIHRHAARLRLGEISLDRFFAETHDDFERLGAKLHRAYREKLPEGVESADLAQEMRAEVVRVIDAWKPNLRPLGDYLVFNCYSKAKKYVQRQRNAEGRNGSAPSRVPTPASRLVRRRTEEGDRRDPLDRQGVEPEQERILAGRDFYARLGREFGRDADGRRALKIIKRAANPRARTATEREARRLLADPAVIDRIRRAEEASAIG